ncbi:MAG: D-glycero-beta-D-manno-heptose 1-phosphate adenylyltransferase [Calditrichaeota bacterium]|nr:MAG: D-glycero-beta-D-manno-heptose 1-phosphate adenylyltransferase [Calditrichota bacterium]
MKSRNELSKIRSELAKSGKKVVFTNGCFDILHRGHVEYLYLAKQQGDILIVGVNDDNSVRRLKGKGRPLTPQEDRLILLAALSMVDYVCLFSEDTPLELIRALQPDILIKGGDYQLDEIVGREVVEKRGGKVLTIPFIKGRSTTGIIEKIIELTKEGIWD